MLLSTVFAHDFNVCKSNEIVKIDSISLNPTQPEVGHPLHIDVTGSTTTVLDHSTVVEVTINALGIKIADEKLNLCDYTECPVSIGDFTISLTQDIPAAAPSDIEIDAKIQIVQATNTLGCVDLETKIVKAPETKHLLTLFNHWTRQHDKTYGSTHEHLRRWDNFHTNLKNIQAYNRQNNGVKLAMNQFGDLSPEEYRQHLSTSVPASTARYTSNLRLGWGAVVPDSIDWVAENKVSAVKNQGQCGSCWAFSTTGSIESAYAIAFNQMVTFSEQELVDCSTEYGNNGCNGGLMDNAFKYVEEHGLSTEADYPYTAADGTCQSSSKDRAVFVTDFTDVKANDEQALKIAVTHGAVSVAIEADQFSFQFYKTGVLKQSTCGTNLDHGVLLVGYGTADDGTDYWKVKNSWGATWGQEGYILLERTDSTDSPGTCGIATTASYPTVRQQQVTDH